MSRRARLRAQAKPWHRQPTEEPAQIDWTALANDLAKREQQPQPKQGPQ